MAVLIASPAWVWGLHSWLPSLTSRSNLSSWSSGFCPHFCAEAALAVRGSDLPVITRHEAFSSHLLHTWAGLVATQTPFSSAALSRISNCIYRLFFWPLCGLLFSLLPEMEVFSSFVLYPRSLFIYSSWVKFLSFYVRPID